ncbi:ATP synthase subunit I [Paenibacillus mucilaginosus]|uniref:ATP synthase subunit I n=1 Tax=Paenibacillus mucilaginosus TaxID=61624 RepID=UPI001EE665A1|nr:ATP synthase subunit I [Paenibacillus mucilaginosus]
MFAGWILGTLASLINAHYLAWKIRRLSDAVLAGRRSRGIGFGTRAAIAILAVWAAYRYPEVFAVWTTITGLIFVQLATLLLGIISIKK